MFLMTNPPRPSRPISVHLNPPNTTIPLKDLKKLAMRRRAHPKPVVRTVDLRSSVIPEDEEVSDFPPNVGAYRNLRREGIALPRVKNSGASKRNTLTLVTGPRSIVQAFNPIYYIEPAEATALRRGHDADIRGAKSSGLLTGWKQKMRNIPTDDDDDEDDSVTSDCEDMPAILPDEYIASGSSSSMDDIIQDPGDKGDNKMSKEKGMSPEERRSPTLKKSPERSARGPDSKTKYKVLYKELCELMSHPQKVHIPCKRERRVPAAANPPVEGPKEEPETIFMSEWIVQDVKARDICVEGKRLDSNHSYWHSNVIMHRIQSDKLKTITGRVYQLVGDVDRAAMSNEGYPPWLIAKFMNGFPEDWKRYVRFFCEVAKRKRLQKMKPKPVGKSTTPPTTSRSRAAAISISDSDNDWETLKKVVSRKPKRAVAIEKGSSGNQEPQTSTAETWGSPTDNTRLSETSCVSTTSRCGRHIKPVLKFWCGERLSVDCLMGTSIVRQGEDMLTHSLERVRNRGLDRRSNAAPEKRLSQKTALKKRTSEGGAQAQLDAVTPKVKAAHKTGVNIPGLNKAKQRKNKALFNSARVILTPMHTKQDIRSKCLTNKVHYDSPSETSGDNSVFNSDLNVEKGRKRGPRREDPSTVRNLTFELDNGEGRGIVTENVDEKVSSLSVKRKQKTIPTRKAKKTRAPSSSESQKNTELHKPVMRRLASTKTGKAAPERRTLPFRRARPVGCFAEYEDIDKEDTPKRNMRKPDNSGKTHLEHGVVHSKQPPRLKPPQYFWESSSDSEDKPRKNSRNPKMRNIIESEDSEKEPITGKSRTATNGEEKQKQIGFLESEDSEDELTLKASRQVANAQKKKKNVALFESQNLEKELKSGKESATTTIDLKKQQKKTEESQDLEGEPILKKAARYGASARKKKKQDGLLESQYLGKDQITEKESSTAPNCGKKQKQIGVVESEDSEEEQMLRKASRQVANAQKKKKIVLLESDDFEEEPVSRKESRTDINAQKEQKLPSRPGRKQKELVESEDSEEEQMLRKASRQKANSQKKKKKVGLLESEEQITRKMQTAADTLKVKKNIKSLVSQDSEQERTSRNESWQTAKTQKIQKTAEEQIGLEEYKDSEDEKMSRKVSSQWINAQKKQATTQPAPDRTQSARLSKIKTTPAEFHSERDVSPGRASRQSGNRKRQPPSDIASSGSPGPSPPYQEQQRKANEEDSQPVSASPQKKSPESRLPFLVEQFLMEPLSNSSSEDEENNSWQELTLPRYTKRAIVSTPAPTRSQHHPGTSQEPECEFEKLQGKPIIPQKNSKKLKPNLHGVSSTEFSSSEEENEDQKAAAGKKKPKATKNMSRNGNSQDGQPQRNVLAVKSSAKWVPLNPYADIIREMEWKEEEIKRLNKAVSSLPKHKTEFWQDVAAAVGVRSAEECYDKFQEILETSPLNAPAKKKVNSRKKQEVNEEKKEVVKISAKVGTLKRKRQMREFLNQMPKDNYDDMFTDDVYRDMKVKLPALPAKSDDDLCVLDNMKPVSPSSPEFPFVATPQCEHITPGMLSPYDSSKNDRLVYRLQKDIKGDMLRLRRPLQKKSGPFFNATPTSRRTTFVNAVPKDIIGKLFAAKDAVTSDEEEEKDYYFSDSDEQ